MTAAVALLRGINVGGHRKVPMARLRTVVEGLGHDRVATHLNSGNVVFVTSGRAAPDALAADVERGLSAELGFTVDVMVRTRTDIDRVVAANPFVDAADEDPSRVLVMFYPGEVTPDPHFDVSAYGNELITWAGTEAYVHYPDGMGRSRLTPDVLTRAAGRAGTGRNWRTVLAVRDLLQARDG